MDAAAQVDALLLLVSGALVFVIVPGFALLYGGMISSAGAVSAMRATLVGAGIAGVLFVIGGYGMLFGAPLIPHVTGVPGTVPGDAFALARACYAGAVCVLAVAIVASAVAPRITLRGWASFAVIWVVLVYLPAGYAVFNLMDGWASAAFGVIDFGGAIPVSVASAAGAAGILLVCGRQPSHEVRARRNVPIMAVGGALVWFGWFGLAIGSEGSVDGFTALIWVNTLTASAASTIAWVTVDRIMMRRPTVASAVCGAVAGLIAITPASGIITTGWALLLGALSGIACAVIVDVAARAQFGTPMVVVVIHLVGSLVGLLFIGLFANGTGMVYSGNFDQLGVQALATLIVAVWSFLISWGAAYVIQRTIGLTATTHISWRDDAPAEPADSPADATE
ncbi:ammonium transporter [Diaminobutyricibacter sp. McL0608]|uniref:ammonium transporter n=1 Tax=Leifsonia sp. McL0608 TaxID=3143537 RepID=UPI0031F3098B